MEVENSPPRRMRRRTSILPGTSISNDVTSTTIGSCDQLAKKEFLERYINAIEDEKKKWNDYESLLKTEYAQVKRCVTDERMNNENYLHYLNDDEKKFLSELDDIKRECKMYLTDINSLKRSYMLLVPELRNQRKRFKQILQKKRESCLEVQENINVHF